MIKKVGTDKKKTFWYEIWLRKDSESIQKGLQCMKKTVNVSRRKIAS